MTIQYYYFLEGKVIVLDERSEKHEFCQHCFEIWLQQNHKLHWVLSPTGEQVDISLNDFWKCHPEYIKHLMEDYYSTPVTLTEEILLAL